MSTTNNIVSGQPLTTEITNTVAPGLLRNEVDQRIVKLRPMATPIDQISRWAACRKAGSMVVDYYAVDSRPETDTLSSGSSPISSTDGNAAEGDLAVADASIYDPSETLMVINDGRTYYFYVISIGTDNKTLHVLTIRGVPGANGGQNFPQLAKGAKIVRMGRAAGELDVQTAQFTVLPRKSSQNCQIFKAQIENSTMMSMANKEAGWTFSDQEETAIYDMRLGMEKSFLFGEKARWIDPVKRSEIFFTGGIWHQAGQETTYTKGALTYDDLLSVMRKAFTGNGGSSRKLMVAGSGLIEELSKMDGGQQRVLLSGDVVTRWGLDFHEVHSKFGTLYVIHSEVFDVCGHENDGLIIDPEYITKYTHIPFNAATLDLRTSGQRNTDAVVLTEASCLVLRYPNAHTRIVSK